jgi:hypothetical protein
MLYNTSMTMHIVKGVYLPKKSKKKPKKIDSSAMELEWRKYNKEMRRTHCHHLQYDTLQEYIEYRLGKRKKYEKKFQEYVPKKTYVREQKHYASAESKASVDSCAKPERKEYSGEYLVGIATMHKSNMVPVGKEDNPKDYSTMRRN